MENFISEAGKRTLLTEARESISASLEGRNARYGEPPHELSASHGVFVTLRTGSGELRGCIGNLFGGAEPLYRLVRKMALASAFEDPRFPALRKEELAGLSIEISVLSDFTESSAEDVVPGKHGILISKASRSGILLPQVAVEQGWDRRQFLSHGCLKAGLPAESWKDKDVVIKVFTALIFNEGDFPLETERR